MDAEHVTPEIHTIPKKPGVYFLKNKYGQILYIGKAKSLEKRVTQHLLKKRQEALYHYHFLNKLSHISYIITKNESEALILEAQLIQQYKPSYNILLKHGQPFFYLLVTKKLLPRLLLARNKKIKGRYYGPFMKKTDARSLYHYLAQTFALMLCKRKIASGCLDYHLGKCAGICKKDFDRNAYQFRLSLAQTLLEKNHMQYEKMLKEKIVMHNQAHEFEKSKQLYHYLQKIPSVFAQLKASRSVRRITVSPEQTILYNNNQYHLQQLLETNRPIVTIDCFDVSHLQNQQTTASSVRFIKGVPEKKQFRHFSLKPQKKSNDCASLKQAVLRRYKNAEEEIPDLILIDGGKGQFNAIKSLSMKNTIIASLAKREETLFTDAFPQGKILDKHNRVAQLLCTIRDYAHHFAKRLHKKRRAFALLSQIQIKK